MTDAHEPNEIDGPHEGPIKTPKQLIMAVVASFVIPIGIIVLLVMYVTNAARPSAGSDAVKPESIAARILPVGHVEIKDATDMAAMKSGEQVFAAQCTACHTAGALGAPKVGDAAAWAPRIKTGFDALWHSALAGKGSMPAQGGGDYSDYEIARAVVYLANKGGATFPEPPAPAAAASAPMAAVSASAPPDGATAPGAANSNADRPAAANTAPLNAAPLNAAPAATNAGSTSPTAQPVIVAAASPPTATAAAAPPALYGQVCSACHAAGVIGAPKVGSKADWAPRAAKGIDALTASAIAGKGAMPPRGGSAATDADIKAVVTYMVNASK